MPPTENEDGVEEPTPEQLKKAMRKRKREERKRLRAAKKIEGQRKQVRLKLGREQKLVAITYEKAAEDWESMLVKISHKSLREDLKVSFLVDKK